MLKDNGVLINQRIGEPLKLRIAIMPINNISQNRHRFTFARCSNAVRKLAGNAFEVV